jgi:hypothetical protein
LTCSQTESPKIERGWRSCAVTPLWCGPWLAPGIGEVDQPSCQSPLVSLAVLVVTFCGLVPSGFIEKIS